MTDTAQQNSPNEPHNTSQQKDAENLILSSFDSQIIKLLSFRIQKEENDHALLTLFIDRLNNELEKFSERMSIILLEGCKDQIKKFTYVKDDQAYELSDYNYWDVHNRCALEFIRLSNLQSAFIECFPQHHSKLLEGITYLRSGPDMSERMDDILEMTSESKYGRRGWEDFPINDYLSTSAFGELLTEANLTEDPTFRGGFSSPYVVVQDNGFGRSGWIRLSSTVQVERIASSDTERIQEVVTLENKEALLDELKLHSIPSSLLEVYPPPQLLDFVTLLQEYWSMLELYDKYFPECSLTEDHEMHREHLLTAGVDPKAFSGHREYSSWKDNYSHINAIHLLEYTKLVRHIAEFSPKWPSDGFQEESPIPMKVISDLFRAPATNWRGSSATFTEDGEQLSIVFKNESATQSLSMTVTHPISSLLEKDISQKITSVEFTVSDKIRNGAEVYTLCVEDSTSARLLHQLMLYHIQRSRTTLEPVPSTSD